MASLANQTISSTYDGLIKTSSDNAVPVSGVQALEDGSGNALALSVGRSGNGVTVSGNLAVDTNTLYVDAASDGVGFGTTNLTVGISNTDTGASVRSVGAIQASRSGNRSLYLNRNTTDGQMISLQREGVEKAAVGVLNDALALYSEEFKFIYTTGAERMRIDSSGRVSINDTVSGSVATNYNPELLVGGNIVARSLTANAALIEIGGDATSAFITAGKQDGSQTARALRFEVGTSERMRIDSSGNVGIGESNPSAVSSGATTLTIKGSTTTKGGALLLRSSDNSVSSYIYPDSTNGLTLGSLSNHNVRFISNSAERMRIDSSGNVGINTSPFTRFTVVGNSAFSPSASGGKATEGIHIRATAGASGNYGAGISLDTGSVGASAIVAVQESADADVNGLAFFTHGSGTGSNASDERMRIKSGGDVQIGASAGAPLVMYPSSDGFSPPLIRWNKTDTASQTAVQFLVSGAVSGSITYSSTATAYNTSSDYRLKENVVEMTGALDRVDALKPSRFNFITDPEKTVDGFLAHEVQAIVPEAVTGEKDAVDEEGNPIYQGIDQSKIVPLLVGAIKELRAEIELLKSQLNA